MFKRAWHYLINTFEVVTRTSYKKAQSLGEDHETKLAANQSIPPVAAMLAAFTPVLQAFLAATQNLNSALGTYKGKTQTVESLFDILNKDKLLYWEGQVHYYFPEGSETATELFPQGRGPFQQGTYGQRILAIKTLGDACALIPDLVTLSTNVLAFHTQIASARALQKTDGEARVMALRSLRETARIALCQQLYSNLAQLMFHYATDPNQVTNYFDMKLLRSRSSSDPNTLTITGRMTDANTGTSIAGGTVTLTLESGVQLQTQTTPSGYFELQVTDLAAPVQGTLLFEAEGYQSQSESGTMDPSEDIELDIMMEPVV